MCAVTCRFSARIAATWHNSQDRRGMTLSTRHKALHHLHTHATDAHCNRPQKAIT